MTDAIFQSILEDVEQLRTAKAHPDAFGAAVHGFQFNPPLSEADVQKFERQHRVLLPQEYRDFLMQVGNGGAGPSYGVFKLGEMDDGFGFARWQENNGFVGTLSLPFPHIAPWNETDGEPEYDETQESEAYDEAYESQMEIFDRRYFDPANVNGAIPICHLGCALRQWLVVTGPEAGNIWCDDRVDRGGLYPLQQDNAARVSFLPWYRVWLDEALAFLHSTQAKQGCPP